MGLFSKFFKRNSKKNINENLNEMKNNEIDQLILEKQLNIHQDIKELLWIEDGPMKNYHHEIYTEEPSLISLTLPVNFNPDINSKDAKLQYYPKYKDLNENQKGIYWMLLENPYNTNIDIGFVFILYYGLERHLLLDENYEKAFNIILKLRHVWENKSFQYYSGNALILTCLLKQRVDLVNKFIKSLKNEFEYSFSDNLFVLCKYSLNLPLSSKDIIRMAKSFEFTKLNYIKNYPEVFEKNLKEIIKETYLTDDIDIKDLITLTEMKNIKKEKSYIYANISIRNIEIDIPLLIDSFKIKKAIYDLLEKAHETTKEQLKKIKEKPMNKTIKPKNVLLYFDKKEEKILLEDLQTLKNPLDKHFKLISIQEFYYKYRNLDSKYIELCIKYCELDIEILKKIVPFYGIIPAFKRLAIIYDKRKEFNKGIDICNEAIQHYTNMYNFYKSMYEYYNLSIAMLESITEFENRKHKMLNKLKDNQNVF